MYSMGDVGENLAAKAFGGRTARRLRQMYDTSEYKAGRGYRYRPSAPADAGDEDGGGDGTRTEVRQLEQMFQSQHYGREPSITGSWRYRPWRIGEGEEAFTGMTKPEAGYQAGIMGYSFRDTPIERVGRGRMSDNLRAALRRRPESAQGRMSATLGRRIPGIGPSTAGELVQPPPRAIGRGPLALGPGPRVWEQGTGQGRPMPAGARPMSGPTKWHKRTGQGSLF